MFKKKYKECFDDIKGSRELLNTILEKSDIISQKHIQFKRIYSYAASCAAIFILTTAVLLFKNGILTHENQLQTTENISQQTKNNSYIQKNVPKTENANANVEGKVSVAAEKNNMTHYNQTEEVKPAEKETQNKFVLPDDNAENKSENYPMIASDEINDLTKKAEKTTDSKEIQAKSFSKQTPDNDSKLNGDISVEESAPMTARIIHEPKPYIFETETNTEIEIGNRIEAPEITSAPVLNSFDAGIDSNPVVYAYEDGILSETYNGSDNKTVTVYSSDSELTVKNGENICDVSMSIYKNDNSYSAYIKGKAYYYIFTENISEEDMIEIVETLVNNN